MAVESLINVGNLKKMGTPSKKMSKLLVVLRNDADYNKTIDYVTNLASSIPNLTIHVLYTADVEPIPADEKVERDFYGKLRKDAEKVVGEAIYKLKNAGINVEFHDMHFGIAAERILKAEKEINPDLIILSSRGLSTLGKIMLGSVSDEVTKNTKVPILIVNSNVNSNGHF